jgi:nucleoside 2-deoxyribosyltransferase
MKLVICGSDSFCKEKVKIKQDLAGLGVEGVLDEWDERVEKPADNEVSNFELKKKSLIIAYFNHILESDGILVANFDKNGIKNYIGANTFLEMGYAFALKKKIFILNGVPNQKYILDELKTFEAKMLESNLHNLLK